MVSWLQSSTKLGRDTAIGCRLGHTGGSNAGLYGSDGSQRTPKWRCTRRSVGRPLSSQPIG